MLQKIDVMRELNARQLSRLRKWQKAWDILAKEQASTKPDAAILKLQLTQLAGWAEAFPNCEGDWQDLMSHVADQYQGLIRRYESELRRSCKERGYEVDGEFPNFMVDGLVKVSVNREENFAVVNGKKTRSLSLSTVMNSITLERQRLWERDFDPSTFLRRLQAAYEAVCRRRGVIEGEYIPIRETYQELKVTDNVYGLDLFAADISRLIESWLGGYTSHGLDFAPVRDSRQAIYVYDRMTRSGRYLGLLRFKRG